MSSRTLIRSATLVTGGRRTDDAWVAFDGDRVRALGGGTPPAALLESATEVVDARGLLLVPGFIDLHVHGGGGGSFDAGADGIRTALAVHRAHGTTRCLMSLVTAGIARMGARAREAVRATAEDPLVVGVHLEGPFLAPGHKGAHPEELLRVPDAESLEALLEAGEGRVRMVTLAPELPGGLDAVRRLVAEGVIAAVGHTDTDYDGAVAAFDAGARVLTHAFNGMHGLHHRAPGPVVAALRDPGVTLEMIADGVHLHPQVVGLAFTGAPGRIALITDAMAAAGAADGDYVLGEQAVQVRGGIARLAEGDSIAGSTLTLDRALRVAVNEAGVPLEAAVEALTETPARVLGRSHELGRIAPGYAADAVLLDESFGVRRVWAAGRPVVG